MNIWVSCTLYYISFI